MLLRHANGRWHYYAMNGSRQISSRSGRANLTPNTDWQLAGIGDLNGDGNDDVLLRHANGRWYYYPMNGRRYLSGQNGLAEVSRDLDRQLAGIGDLDGDGRDDILLRGRSDGRWYYYPMNGRRSLTGRGLANLTRDTNWQFAGIGDLNGDGNDDVLLRRVTDGRWYYYPMNGRRHIVEQRGGAGIVSDPAWQLAGIGDLNGDGNDDVLLRHTDGRWLYYPMNGRETLAGGSASVNLTTDTDWATSGPADGAATALVVESLYASNSHLTSGESFTLTATVRNRGETASAAAQLRFFRSADSRITRADTQVTESPVPVLDAGAGFTGTVSLNAPAEKDVYYYGACLDTAGGGTGGNNCSGGVRVEVDAPDLAVSSLAGGGNLRPGASFTLSAGVRNWGQAPSAPSRLRYYRSADSLITPEDTVVHEGAIDGIEAGRSYRTSVTLTAPAGAGVYWYGACAEPVAGESNTDNNCSTGVSVGVNVPDLLVSVLELYLEEQVVTNSRALQPGDPYALRATVVNRGHELSQATVLRFYLSQDGRTAPGGQEVGTARVGSLAPGSSAEASITRSAPSDLGTFWYVACVDALPGETDTGNNCLNGGWFQVARPDLVVEEPTVSDANLASGGSFSLSVTLANRGGAASAATRLRYYRSTDATISASDTQVGVESVPALPPSDTRSLSVTLAAPDTAGSWWYGACAERLPGESDAGNNCSTGVRVSVDQPDLTVERPTVSDTTPAAGASFRLSVAVRNLGHGPSDAATLRYYRSSDRTISSTDAQVGTDSVSALPASGSESESITLSAPSQDGTYYYGACVDSVSTESNIDNNCSPGVPVRVGGEDVIIGEMVSIPAGTFRMGDLSGEGLDDEQPVRSVSVPAFKLGKYEVTYAQWDACVADGGCNGYIPYDYGWGRGNRPVINVSWNDTQFFIDWLNMKTGGNYRLPTEAEWEYAARAGSTTEYSWGNDIGSNRANCDNDYCGDSWDYTAPVGSFPANPWGLHDMHGNVWEWAQDCWNDSYEGAPTDGSAWTSGNCGRRVVRGGAWNFFARYLRSAYRIWDARTLRNGDNGFRLAQDE